MLDLIQKIVKKTMDKKGYKIYYGEYDHDCWGKPEWCGWYEYDDTIYLNIDECKNDVRIAEQKHPDREFKVFEVNVK